jgi:hypothetical protein
MFAKTYRRLGTLGLHLAVILLLLPGIYYGLCLVRVYQVHRITQERLHAEGVAPNTAAFLVTEGRGFNPGNLYWAVVYDCRETDVEITGIVPKARYWSMVPYDFHTLPLDSYLFDGNVVKDPDGRYTAYLTTRPKGRPNEIDVSAAPAGGLVIRISFPEDAAAANAAPSVRPVARD